jgi:hypothetical protein
MMLKPARKPKNKKIQATILTTALDILKNSICSLIVIFSYIITGANCKGILINGYLLPPADVPVLHGFRPGKTWHINTQGVNFSLNKNLRCKNLAPTGFEPVFNG